MLRSRRAVRSTPALQFASGAGSERVCAHRARGDGAWVARSDAGRVEQRDWLLLTTTGLAFIARAPPILLSRRFAHEPIYFGREAASVALALRPTTALGLSRHDIDRDVCICGEQCQCRLCMRELKKCSAWSNYVDRDFEHSNRRISSRPRFRASRALAGAWRRERKSGRVES